MKTYVVMPHYIITPQLLEYACVAIDSIKKSSDAIVISVDDGSPLDCKEITRRSDYYLRNEKNSGFAPTCNRGFKWIFEHEKEDCYIICANNDIEVYEGFLEALKEPFEKLDNVAVSGIIHTRFFDGHGVPTYDGRHPREYRGVEVTNGGMCKDYMQDGGLWCSKKSILQKVGIFDEQFIRGGYEDVDLFLRMRDTFGMKIIMSERRMYFHREGATRWNSINTNQVNNFGNESRNIEGENLVKFTNKWGFNPHSRQLWRTEPLILS